MVNEIFNWHKETKKKLLVLKLDFAKAYDCVSWEFLDNGMQQMKFGKKKWRKWIRGCFQSGRVSILINESPTRDFCMERGLHQGDPISPFPFLITEEAVNVMMLEAVDK